VNADLVSAEIGGRPNRRRATVPEYTKLTAELRTEFGKGAARRIRRADKVPAVIYGHGAAPLHVTLPGHETMLALKQSNALLQIVVDGKEQLALAKDVQRDVIRRFIEHVDFVTVKKGEKVNVEIAVHIEGEAAPDTLVNVDLQEIELAVDATNIPERIVVSVEGLGVGARILAGDLALPAGAELLTDPEYLVVGISQTISEEALEAELEEAEAEAGIEHEEPEAEAEGDEKPAEGDEKPAEGDES
jgi:large subunit ribosomal protein L25